MHGAKLMHGARFQCAGCGEWIETTVDESGGSKQQYVEDCQVCCRPNVLTILLGWVGPGIRHNLGAGELDSAFATTHARRIELLSADGLAG